ncbi:hypothetical protein KEJ39_08460 [Candidatus Bathyarchaeota archaeon]|nr:hypothetical protein [Candidatus Bathyarchaeota archaeon]
MRIQVTLTPPESKRLIAKAVAKLDAVQKAWKKGIILVGASTTCAFVLEELTKRKITRGYGCGITIPRGTCIMWEMLNSIRQRGYAKTWTLEKGKLHEDLPVDEVLKRMGAGDVFIKGANAIDPWGNAGIFLGSPIGGTVGRVIGSAMAKGITIVIPVGLEKMIPTPISRAAIEAGSRRMDYSMGMPVGLLPLSGTVIDEVKAFQVLTRAEAIPIGAGGVDGAEGAVTLVIKGPDSKVRKSLQLANSVKGTRQPATQPPECRDCRYPGCSLGGTATR